MEYKVSEDYINFLKRSWKRLHNNIDYLDSITLSNEGYFNRGFHGGRLHQIEQILDEIEPNWENNL